MAKEKTEKMEKVAKKQIENAKSPKSPLTSSKENSKCDDKNCHIHGNLKVRGRTFEGTVIKKFHKRIVIEFERMIYIRKYERYMKGKTKIHAHLSSCMEDSIRVGDLVLIRECRPLSKIIHFAVIEKIKGAEENKK